MSDWVPLDEWRTLPAVCGLYIIRHRESGREYVGKSVNVRKRLSLHRRYASSSIFLGRAIAAHGSAAFDCCIYATGTDAEMLVLEVLVIAERGSFAPGGFNLTIGGEGSSGWKPDAEQKEKARQAAMKPKSAATRAAMAEANRNRPASHWEAVAAKTRARVVSEVTRAKQAHNARNRSPEHLAKISAGKSGQRPSESTRAKMSAARSKAVLVWPAEAMVPLEFASASAAGVWFGKSGAHVSLYISGRLRAPHGCQVTYL